MINDTCAGNARAVGKIIITYTDENNYGGDSPVIAAVYHFPHAACTTRWPSRTDIHSGSSDRCCHESMGKDGSRKKNGDSTTDSVLRLGLEKSSK